MKFRYLVLSCFIFTNLSAEPADRPRVTDIRGQEVVLDTPARKVVSLTPHITELLFVLGAAQAIIATVEYSDWPEEALTIPRIGDAFRVDREQLLLLDPDLVVAWDSGTPRELVEWLENRSIPVYVTDALELAGIPRSLRDLGTLTGNPDGAEEAALAFEQALAELAERHTVAAPLRVFYQISPQPLYTVGGRHLISEVLSLCGGQNVFAELDQLAPTVSVEAVIQQDPDVIMAGSWPETESPLAAWSRFPMLTAVRNNALFTVNADLLHRSTPRTLDAVINVCEQLEAERNRRLAAEEG